MATKQDRATKQRLLIQKDINAKAPTYGDKYKTYSYSTRSFHIRKQLALSWLNNSATSVLDAGCGPAVLLPDLYRRGFRTYGIDLAGAAVREGRNRLDPGSNVGLVVGDLTRLPFAAQSFDAIVSLGVLEYVIPLEAALQEFRRVLRPGAQLVVSLPNRRSLYRTWERLVYVPTSRALKSLRQRQVSTYSRAEFVSGELRAVFGPLGFEIERLASFAINPFVQPTARIAPKSALAVSDWLEKHLRNSRLREHLATEILIKARVV